MPNEQRHYSNELNLESVGINLPYNMQAEQSVLGAALVDETVLNRLITDMEPEMFYSDQNRAIYETMRSLYTCLLYTSPSPRD